VIAALALGLLLQASPYAPMTYPGADPQLAERIRDLCPVPLTTNRQALLENEDRLANRVRDARSQVTASQWAKLACGRALLDAIGAPSRASHLMHAGTSWRDGALDATIYASRLPEPDSVVYELMALLVVADAQAEVPPGFAEAMRRAVAAGIRSPLVLRACADFTVRAGDAEGVGTCAEAGLAGGQDSTWHLLRLVRQRFREADSLDGMRLFELAADAARDDLARRDVEWHLQWFLSPGERAAWDTIPDSLRGAWVRDRLVERDLRDGRPLGARLAEHFARLEYVERHFMMDGPPGWRDRTQNGAATYQGVDGAGNAVNETIWREYRRWQVDFDDRGVVWMRFGKPERVVRNVPPAGQPSLETWRYTIGGESMLVTFSEADFDGSSGTTTLVVGKVGPWHCGIDAWRCLLAERMLPGMGGIPPEQMLRVRDADREYLAIATTKDDNSPREQARTIGTVAQVQQLWDVVTAEPVTIASYGLRLEDLAVATDSGGGERAVADLVLRWWLPASAEWQEDSLPARFAVPARRSGESHLTAFKVYPGLGGIGSWGLVATQPDRRWGRAWGNATPLDEGRVALSDLIVAPESRGLSWVHRGERIFLSPGGTLKRSEPLRLYFQVRSEAAMDQATTTIEVRRMRRGVVDSVAGVGLTFAAPLRSGITASNRLLDLAELSAGSYLLEVRVADKTGAFLARRTLLLDLE
jgi:hypothetical protein